MNWSATKGQFVVLAIALLAAAVWRPYRWTIFAPALVAALGLLSRRLYLMESPPDYFLEDRARADNRYSP